MRQCRCRQRRPRCSLDSGTSWSKMWALELSIRRSVDVVNSGMVSVVRILCWPVTWLCPGCVYHGWGALQLQNVTVPWSNGGRRLRRHVEGGRESDDASGLQPHRLPAQVPHVNAGQKTNTVHIIIHLQTIVVCFHLCPSLCCCVYVSVSVSVVKIVKAVKGNSPSPMSSRLLLWSVCPSLPVYLICPVLLMSSVLSGFLLLSVYACWRGTTKKKPASARLPLHHFFFFFYLTLNPDQPV